MSEGPRVLGFDPGTVSTDLCVLDNGRPAHAVSVPTVELAKNPGALLEVVQRLGRLDLIAAPSGYGLPLLRGPEVGERELRLAFLAPPGEASGILGLRRAAAALVEMDQPLVFLPGVLHLPTVPAHRKANRVDMGTADKVCAAALAIAAEARRRDVEPGDVSLVLVEMGGAFTAALGVEAGEIVDGLGGSSGPLGFRALGALDGEAAALAGIVPKDALFTGGAAWIAGEPGLDPAEWEARSRATTERSGPERPSILPDRRSPPGGGPDAASARMAREAYLEGIVKAVAALRTSAPSAGVVALSGRLARLPRLVEELSARLARIAPGLEVRRPGTDVAVAEPLASLDVAAGPVLDAALGAAFLADGLSGGVHAPLVRALRLAEASGGVLDQLYWPPARAGAERFTASLA
jgi:predicted butyrate kinase (DUF1464 family)